MPRPPYEQLLADLREMSWLAVGAKSGVSDHAVRKCPPHEAMGGEDGQVSTTL